MSLAARLCATAVFVIAAMSLRAQFDVSHTLLGQRSVGQTLWRMAGYFTILTNLGVAFGMAAVGLRWRMPGRIAGALTLAILAVGLVYHLILARLWSPEGAAWWADQGLHTAVPVAMLAWWVAFAPRDVGARDIGWWLVWPVVYGAYALLRGAMTGFWPYPFLDVDSLGAVRAALNLGAMLLAFAALGAALVVVARRLRSIA